MILSQLFLNPRSPGVQAEIGNLYELHRSLMSAFPDQTDRERAGLLFRLETARDPVHQGIPVLVQSLLDPDWRILEARPDYLLSHPVRKKSMPAEIDFESPFRFALRANPTRRGNQSRKLTPLYKEEDLIKWIDDKANLCGFSVTDGSLLIRKMPPWLTYKKVEGKRMHVKIEAVDFSGELRVVNRDEFTRAWQCGIGRAKTFGCGMLSLARLSGGQHMFDLHLLPKLRDSLSYLYVEHAVVERKEGGVVVFQETGRTTLPVSSLGCLMLGPGTTISHAAVRLLADNGCNILWTAQDMNNFYAQGFGETRRSAHILRQAQCVSDDALHRQVVLSMYEQRFGHRISPYFSIDQVRGLEGARVRTLYQVFSKKYGVPWKGRAYDPGNWEAADPINRAISAANALLYGVCHVAIVAAGYSLALGFVHSGYYLAFVHDIADLYKHETTLPAAFATVAESPIEVVKRVRVEVRELIRQTKILKRIIPEIDGLLQIEREEDGFEEDSVFLPQPWWGDFSESEAQKE